VFVESAAALSKKSAALHEFGHAAGFLDDITSDNQVVMYESYVHRSSLSSHDVESMNAQYYGHS
jgi:predicted Zn-dependent protease